MGCKSTLARRGRSGSVRVGNGREDASSEVSGPSHHAGDHGIDDQVHDPFSIEEGEEACTGWMNDRSAG